MQFLPLAATLLRPDKLLAWNLYDETGELLLRRGFMLSDPNQIASLIKRGVFVEAEDYKAWQQLNLTAAPPPAPPPPPVKALNTFTLRDAIAGKLLLLLRNAGQEPDFTAHTQELAHAIKVLVDGTPDVALAGIQIHEHSKYAVAHSVDVAILVEFLSRKLDWTDDQRCSTVCAALTMNLGMAEAQSIMALQRMAITEIQRKLITEHPQAGHALLQAAGVEDALWLQIALDHHEAPDGSGYPGAKTALNPETLLLRTADIYSALLIARPTRKALDSASAIKAVFVQEKQHQNEFGGLLLKELGLYPPGALVKLKNGDTAVVSRRACGSTPLMVHSFINSHGIPMLEPMWRETSRAEFALVGGLTHEDVKVPVDIEKIWAAQVRN
ncbi:hypothetical protein GCM10027046_03050 [Uliginosibacterium flavum]|uniref:HD domain-containing phosphohydrolase n=1 Tax=Uliginosibacterium flavum TaxID=1396831 RepID=A0ABV2TIZ4_9RHOO